MKIQDLYRDGTLGFKTYSICAAHNVHTIDELKVFIKKQDNYKTMFLCGTVSIVELTELISHLELVAADEKEVKDNRYLRKVLAKLNLKQLDALKKVVFVETLRLSPGSSSVIRHLLKKKTSVSSVVETFLIPTPLNIKNIKGIKSDQVIELESYLEKIEGYLMEIEKDASGMGYINLHAESIFLKVNEALDTPLLFSPSTVKVLMQGLHIYKESPVLSKKAMAAQLGITRERVRQLMRRCIEDLYLNLSFIQNINDDLHRYHIQLNKNNIDVNKTVMGAINGTHRLNFSKAFITYILYVYLQDRYYLLGEPGDILIATGNTKRTRYQWQHFYLIAQHLAMDIDFDSMAFDIDQRLKRYDRETYTIDFKTYISGFSINGNLHFLNDACTVCEWLLAKEFGIRLVSKQLVFKRKNKKLIPEYVVEALEHIGKPSKTIDLFNWIEARYPGTCLNLSSVSTSCVREKKIMVCGGRNSFALRAWENDPSKHVKGGNIRDLTIAILEQTDTPLHIGQILKYVNTYRDKAKERNVLTNLKQDGEPNRFVFYPYGFIGLKRKTHLYDVEKYNHIPISLTLDINRLIFKGLLTTPEDVNTYLQTTYQLTPEETESIISRSPFNYSNIKKRNTQQRKPRYGKRGMKRDKKT